MQRTSPTKWITSFYRSITGATGRGKGAAVSLLPHIDSSVLPGSLSKGLDKAKLRAYGWEELAARIEARRRAADAGAREMLFTWDYENAAMLSWQRPQQAPVLALVSVAVGGTFRPTNGGVACGRLSL